MIENKPGTGGNLASDLVAKATPDGYTLLHGTENVFISNPHVYGARMPFDPFKDLVPVTSLVSNQIVLAVQPVACRRTACRSSSSCAKSTKPPMFYASIGNGSNHHLAMEMLKQHVGIDLTHVPYRGGGPAAIALLAGEVSAMFGGGSVVPTIKSGKLRGLATTGTVRNPATPELPTIAEIYPGYEALSWHGLFAPAGTPQPIIDRLREEMKEVAGAARVQGAARQHRLRRALSGRRPRSSPPASRRDYEKYGKLIRVDRRQGRVTARRYGPIQPTIAPMISSAPSQPQAVDHGQHRPACRGTRC